MHTSAQPQESFAPTLHSVSKQMYDECPIRFVTVQTSVIFKITLILNVQNIQ
jgi:hypothetical protein